MNCEQTRRLLDAYIDHELDMANALAVDHHLANCSTCKQRLEVDRTLQQNIRQALTYQFAPEQLNRKIREKLFTRESAAKEKFFNIGKSRFTIAIAAACSLVLSFSMLIYVQHQRQEARLLQDVLVGHLRTLTTDNMTTLDSADTEQIKPWFRNRLDFAPRVYDFADQGFELQGARLEYIQQQSVASLTYKDSNHLYNLFIWPSPQVEDEAKEIHSKQGYQILYWCQDHMNYWLISEASRPQVETFADTIHNRIKSK